jgi:hypothetical protein
MIGMLIVFDVSPAAKVSTPGNEPYSLGHHAELVVEPLPAPV